MNFFLSFENFAFSELLLSGRRSRAGSLPSSIILLKSAPITSHRLSCLFAFPSNRCCFSRRSRTSASMPRFDMPFVASSLSAAASAAAWAFCSFSSAFLPAATRFSSSCCTFVSRPAIFVAFSSAATWFFSRALSVGAAFAAASNATFCAFAFSSCARAFSTSAVALSTDVFFPVGAAGSGAASAAAAFADARVIVSCAGFYFQRLCAEPTKRGSANSPQKAWNLAPDRDRN